MASIKLCWLIVFLIQIVISSVAVIATFPKSSKDSVLTNTQKQAIANEIDRINLNKSVQPCNNFYEYTCGSSKHYGNYLHHMKQNPDDVLARYFASDVTFTNSEHKAKEFYISCKSQRHLHKLKQLDIYKVIGGWPLLDQRWMESKFSLPQVLAEFRKIGVNVFIDLSITTMNNQKVFYIRPNKKYHPFQEDQILLFYNALNPELANNTVDSVLKEFREFDGQRGRIDAEHSHQVPDYIAYRELKELVQFDWNEYFQTFLGKDLEDSNKVVLHEHEELSHLLNLVTSYNKRIVANYIWSVFVVDANRMCSELLEEYFPTMYAKLVYSPPFEENDILQMLNGFQYTHERIIKNGKWSIPGNHALALEIFKAIKSWTRYISEKVELEYSNLHIEKDNFYRNLVSGGLHKTEEEMSDLYYVMNLYQTPVLSLYDYYRFMDDSSYDKTLPMSINYARLGTIFGFYAIRLWNNSVEWETSEKFRDEYMILKTCLSKQVYFSPKKPIGENSQDTKFYKNGGDPMHWTVILHGAVKLALESYNNWLKNNNEISLEENIFLRDYQLNNIRLFFIAHASLFCTDGKYLSSAINAELMNLPEFAEAFQCPLKSRMNPSSKCKIW